MCLCARKQNSKLSKREGASKLCLSMVLLQSALNSCPDALHAGLKLENEINCDYHSNRIKLGHACNPSAREAETGGS